MITDIIVNPDDWKKECFIASKYRGSTDSWNRQLGYAHRTYIIRIPTSLIQAFVCQDGIIRVICDSKACAVTF